MTTSSSGPRLGAHMSAAGGPARAVLRGRDVGCETIALFSASPRVWKRKEIPETEIHKFQEMRKETGIDPIIMHALYLANPASPDPDLLARSMDAIKRELIFCRTLNLAGTVMHPGSHLGTGESTGIKRIAESLDQIFKETGDTGSDVFLETTVGTKNSLGGRFEHLRDIIGTSCHPDRIQVCLDTCHVFAAGYDIRTVEGWESTLDEFDRIIGLNKLAAIHLNDSKTPLGSHRDRHEHIGDGEIGLESFRYLMQTPRLKHIPMVLETPKDAAGEWDRKNLGILKGFRGW